jgi:hypothetical protein
MAHIAGASGNQYEMHGARIGLNLPNGRQLRINARHDHRGHSMWNPAHGSAKAAQLGPDDHIYVAGHKHTFANQWHRQASGVWSLALKVGAYKIIDPYAHEIGLAEQNLPSVTTLVFPDADDAGFIELIRDVELAADLLTWLRSEWAAGRSATRKRAGIKREVEQ